MVPLQYRLHAAMDRGARDEQQDAVNSSFPELQKDLGVLCVLSDGMGGLAGGEKASRAVVETMVSTFHRSSVSDTPEQILLRACCFSQQAVRALQTGEEKTGATLAAVLLRNSRCSFLSVGDSRVYLYRGGGLIQLTRDQNKLSRIERQIGLGRLPEEARSDVKKAALTAFMGMEELTRVDRGSRSFEVGPGDRLLLVSDGVFHTLSEGEMTEIMRMPGEMATMAMITRVTGKGLPRQDNCSAAMVDCEAEGIPSSPGFASGEPLFPDRAWIPISGYAQWRGTRQEQNDVVYLSGEDPVRGSLVALADGIGLDESGGLAAAAAVDAMREEFFRAEPERELHRQALRLIGAAHRAVLAQSEENLAGGAPPAGAAAACVLVRDRKMTFCSAGNVRVFLLRTGLLLQLSRDHLLSLEAEERDILSGEAPDIDPEWAKRVTSFVGMEGLQQVDCQNSPVSLRPADRVIVMSSGLYGVLGEEEIADVAACAPPAQAAEEIIRRVKALRHESQSNVSVAILQVGF